MNRDEFKHDPNAEEWVDPYPKKKRRFRWLTGAIVFLAIYVLSTGPVCLLKVKGNISRETLNRVYMPLIVVADAWPVASRFFDWYVSLWLSPRYEMRPTIHS